MDSFISTRLDQDMWIRRRSQFIDMPGAIIHLFLRKENSHSLAALTGLTASSAYSAYYMTPDDNSPQPLQLAVSKATKNEFGFWEIDGHLLPGLYGLKIPDGFLQPGYSYLHIKFLGARPIYIELHGVNYDPFDSFALGLTTWIRSNCHEHLTSGLRKSMPATLRPLLVEGCERR